MIKTILLVDDSNSSRELTGHFLRQGGYRILEAGNGQEALDILEDRPVDIIVADIMMPVMDGWTLYHKIREQKRYNLTPFLFLSGLDDLGDQVKGLSLGVDDYITKPITAPKLIARVGLACNRSDRMEDYFYRDPVSDMEFPSYFKHRMLQEVHRCRTFKRPLSLVIAGMGNYEAIVRGQADWFAEVAATEAGLYLRQRIRDYDTISYLSVGRFAILMPEVSAAQAKTWSDKLRAAWQVSARWPETEQQIDIDIEFIIEGLSPNNESDAIEALNTHLDSFKRSW
ncbi:MAG: response regulator [Mariprofundaceae bacterium]|nr:response regulator [Mariprofundaceae bacterium]